MPDNQDVKKDVINGGMAEIAADPGLDNINADSQKGGGKFQVNSRPASSSKEGGLTEDEEIRQLDRG